MRYAVTYLPGHPSGVKVIEPVTKQCGNCKWWDVRLASKIANGKTRSYCLNAGKLKGMKRSFLAVDKYDGRDCQVYEERDGNSRNGINSMCYGD